MGNNITAIIIVFSVLTICVGFPVALPILLHHRREMRKEAGPTKADQQTVNTLLETARRMEARLGYLENVLDTEVPGWRNRSDLK